MPYHPGIDDRRVRQELAATLSGGHYWWRLPEERKPHARCEAARELTAHLLGTGARQSSSAGTRRNCAAGPRVRPPKNNSLRSPQHLRGYLICDLTSPLAEQARGTGWLQSEQLESVR